MDALILVDVLDAHRSMISRQRLPLAFPGRSLVIGRDVGCDIIVNDPYAAGRHAELSLHEDGTVRVTDLNTINGLILQGERIKGSTPVRLEDGQVQIGHSHLLIRTTTERLAPERPDLESLRSRHREYGVSVAGVVLCIGFGAFTAWVGSPDNVPLAAAKNLLFGSVALGAWLAFWVALGRALRSRWQWVRNAAITCGAAAAYLWLNWGIQVAEYSTGVPLAERLGPGLAALVAGVAIYLHIRIASRQRRGLAALLACVVPLVSVLAFVWFSSQRFAEDVNHIAAPGHLFPPSWSNRHGVQPDRFLERGREIRDVADQRREEATALDGGN